MPSTDPPPPLSSSPPPAPPDSSIEEAPSPSGGLFWRLGGMVKTLRPHQWLKNAFVLAPVVFAKDIFRAKFLLSAGAAFLVFCLLAGAVYTMNDLVDVEADRVHPVKRKRPIPSGRVPLGLAKGLAVGLVVLSLGGAFHWCIHRFK